MIARIAQIARFEQRCLEKSSHKFVTIDRYVLLRTYSSLLSYTGIIEACLLHNCNACLAIHIYLTGEEVELARDSLKTALDVQQ